MHIPAIALIFVRVRKVVSNSHGIPGLTDYVVFYLFSLEVSQDAQIAISTLCLRSAC